MPQLPYPPTNALRTNARDSYSCPPDKSTGYTHSVNARLLSENRLLRQMRFVDSLSIYSFFKVQGNFRFTPKKGKGQKRGICGQHALLGASCARGTRPVRGVVRGAVARPLDTHIISQHRKIAISQQIHILCEKKFGIRGILNYFPNFGVTFSCKVLNIHTDRKTLR